MPVRPKRFSTIKRWYVFNSVGAMGFVVQISILFLLTSRAGLNYLLSTGLAVEAAVVHNFFWHEHWTWADRSKAQGHFLKRFLGFHAANGVLSIAGNIILMRLFVDCCGFGLILSNVLAIAICSIFNFFAGDLVVFRESRDSSIRGGIDMIEKSCRTRLRAILLPSLLLAAGLANAVAAELQPDTLKAWNAAVEKVEQRVSSELASDKGFLALDFQDPSAAGRELRKLLSGSISVDRVDADGIKVPNGMVHHWRGTVFIPGATLDSVLSRIENPTAEDAKQEDVLESKVVEKRPGQHTLYLKLQRSKIVTVVYNTEHLVRYGRHGTGQAFSSSVATKIAEIKDYGERTEREMPEGRDHGYLWRMNSYWRYQAVSGGVIVECESMTLSRSIPSLLEYIVRPLINRVANESMKRTLESMRTRIVGLKLKTPLSVSRSPSQNRNG